MLENLNKQEEKLYKLFKKKDPSLTDLGFAQICLRATARDYAEANDNSERARMSMLFDRAALMFAIEALHCAHANDLLDGINVDGTATDQLNDLMDKVHLLP